MAITSSIMGIKIQQCLCSLTLIILLCLSSTVLSVSFYKIQLPRNAKGPEALAFERRTGNFHTGVTDGRILKYDNQTRIFEDFGTFAPNRSKSVCDGRVNDPVCGRPVGMALHHATKRLYICDAFFGFGVLGPNGGNATILSTGAEGKPYRFCNAVDVHQQSGDAYFTDASATYNINQLLIALIKKDSTGRLLKYDSKTKQVTVLYRNLSGPGGVAVDQEARFVLVSEFIAQRTIKIWLKGPKANKSEIINTQPTPDNIKRIASSDDFWLAAARSAFLSSVPIGLRFNATGNVSQTVNFQPWYGNKQISEVQEYQGKLHVGSRLANVDYIGVLKL